MCLNRLDSPEKFANLDFAINFGIDMETRKKFAESI
jgi:hypothetical protein